MDSSEDNYSPIVVKDLFNEMSYTYGLVNLVASFGFTAIWRKICTSKVPSRNNARVVDLMTGMGELYPSLARKFRSIDRLVAIDFSSEMCKSAKKNSIRWPSLHCDVIEVDALQSKLQSSETDYVFCSFGLKTLSKKQQEILAKEVARILRPGGHFSFIEISVPKHKGLRLLFLLYLRIFIPIIGRLFLGNPSNYRMLAVYTEDFESSDFFLKCLQKENLITNFYDHFFGCATGVFGSKPEETLVG